MTRPPRMVVIGYGHRDRGDDAAGFEVVQLLHGKLPPGVCLCFLAGEGTRLLELWEVFDVAVVVDAMQSGRAPGTVLRASGKTAVSAAADALTSTHSIGLREALVLGELTGRLPGQLIFYGIEAGEFDIGAPVSEPVREATKEVAARILDECRAAMEEGG